MNASEKKVSFSFSKIKKTTLPARVNNDVKEKIEYVDCFDGSKGKFSYKGNFRREETQKKDLVIPLISSKSSDYIQNRRKQKFLIKDNNVDKHEKNNIEPINNPNDEKTKSEMTMDEMAATELLNDIKDGLKKVESPNKLIITANTETSTHVENTIDYDQVPVGDFGMAMLRGMGWKPDCGIGKDPRLVSTVSPKLRPKGLGLGAKHKFLSNEDNNKKSV